MAATWFSPMTTHAPARAQVPARRHTVVRPRASLGPVPMQVPVPTRPGWLERLALWADARPTHRRMGSWTMDC